LMDGAKKERIGPKEERKLEKVERLLSSIRQFDEERILLVEGRRDMEALRKLGIEGKIFCLLTGKGTLPERLEKVSAKHVLVLVDFDPEGERLAHVVSHMLNRRGVNADLSVWRSIRSYLKKDVRDIEGLANYLLRRSGEAR